MKNPTDNPRRPSRPARRFSVIKAPVKRTGAPAEPVLESEEPDEAPAVAEADISEPMWTAPADLEAAVERSSPASAATPPPAPRERAPTERAETAAAKRDDEARVAKVMSRAGVCSRREAEAWILAGRVAVNGAIVASPALNIGPGDQVTVDGYPIDKPERTRLFMFHKTRGLVTTARDPEGRPTIYDALPEDLPRLITVGRLDINTEGLLLLTNDGGLARLLELPSTGWLRRYRVRANGHVDQGQLDALAKGVSVEGVDYAGIDAKLDRIQGANLWMTLGLREGKNREVKRVLEHLGLAVTRLIRISFGPFQLGDLAENAVEEVRTRVLRDQLGSTLAKQAGLDLRTAEDAISAVAPSPPDEPRRKTSRSATADRRGRAVTVERIANVSRPAPPSEARARPEQRGAPGRDAPRDERSRAPVRASAAPEGRGPRGADRPARTLRQSDAAAQRRETMRSEGPRDARRPDRPRSDERPPRSTGAPARGERARFGGRTRDSERPRTGRNKDEADGRRAPPRPSAERTRSARPEGGDTRNTGRPGKPARSDGPPSGRSGGKPPSRSGDSRPGRPGGGPGKPGGRPRS